jgi:SpoVK/Ycf46/Vps4 family AAA+-type ATPase
MNAMIGLDRVKRHFNDLFDLAEMDVIRRESGMEPRDRTMHQVFSGPPGTGKTSAARLLAEGYYASGLVSSPKLVEKSGRDLVSEFASNSAKQVTDIFDESKGKVLFIDEAHNMVTGPNDKDGLEALGQFVKLSLDRRSDTVVILAGYEGENGNVVEHLAQYDPGIRRRFPNQVPFDPYTDKQLGDIGETMVKRNDWKLDDDAKKMFRLAAAKAGRRRDENAGGVENFVNKIYTVQSRRLAAERKAGKEKFSSKDLQKVTVEDVKAAIEEAEF